LWNTLCICAASRCLPRCLPPTHFILCSTACETVLLLWDCPVAGCHVLIPPTTSPGFLDASSAFQPAAAAAGLNVTSDEPQTASLQEPQFNRASDAPTPQQEPNISSVNNQPAPSAPVRTGTPMHKSSSYVSIAHCAYGIPGGASHQPALLVALGVLLCMCVTNG
jgi:hypothetical protein